MGVRTRQCEAQFNQRTPSWVPEIADQQVDIQNAATAHLGTANRSGADQMSEPRKKKLKVPRELEVAQYYLEPFLQNRKRLTAALVEASGVRGSRNGTLKHFYITYGPPGSGKGDVMKKIAGLESAVSIPGKDEESRRVLNTDDEIDGYISSWQLVKVIVDDMLASLQVCVPSDFKIEGIGKSPCDGVTLVFQRDDCFQRCALDSGEVDNHGDGVLLTFNRAKDACLIKGGKIASQKFYWDLRTLVDVIGDDVMKGAERKGRNIQLEMTGRKIAPNWFATFLDNEWKRNYHVVVGYPYVQIGTLVKRAQSRQKKTGQEAAPVDRIRDIAVGASATLNAHAFRGNIQMLALYDNEADNGGVNQADTLYDNLLFAHQTRGKEYAFCGWLEAWLNSEICVPLLLGRKATHDCTFFPDENPEEDAQRRDEDFEKDEVTFTFEYLRAGADAPANGACCRQKDTSTFVSVPGNPDVLIAQAMVEANLRQFVRPLACQEKVYDLKYLKSYASDVLCENIRNHIEYCPKKHALRSQSFG